MPTTRIGVDIGTTQVRVAEVETAAGRPPRLLRFGAVDLEPGAVRDGVVVRERAVADALRELWRRCRLKGGDIALGVGNERVYVRELTVPAAPPDQLRQSLRYVSGDLLPVAPDDCVLDFQPYAQRGDDLDGLLVAVPEEVVRAAIGAAKAARLRVAGVDLSAFALVRALLRGAHAQGTVAVVDVGAHVTQVVVAEDLRPRLVRFVGAGGDDLTAALGQVLGLDARGAERLKATGASGQPPDVQALFTDHARALIDTISQTAAYHVQGGGRPIDGLLLTGRGSLLPGLGQYVATATSIPVALGDATQGLTLAGHGDRAALAAAGAALPVAIGLAVAA